MLNVESSISKTLDPLSSNQALLMDAGWLTYMQSLVDALPNDAISPLSSQTSSSHTPTDLTASDKASQVIDTLNQSDHPITASGLNSSSDSDSPLELDRTLELESHSDSARCHSEINLTNGQEKQVCAEDELPIDWGQHPFSQLFSRILAPLPQDFVQQVEYDSSCWEEQREINCLLFTIGATTFAAPLVTLGHIFALDEESKIKDKRLSRIPTLPPWIVGRFSDKRLKPTVLDGYKTLLAKEEKHLDPEHIITFGNGDWGVTCNIVSRSATVATDQIQWRRDPKVRPWSRGTLLKEMCTLLDVPLIIRALQFDKN